MLVAETCLLTAVRNTIRTGLTLDADHCEIELDDQVPAITGKTYVAVTGAGTSPGERHASSGGVHDLRMNVRVTVYKRITEIARDRRRNIFLDLLTGLNKTLDQVIVLIDNNQTLRTAAQTLVQAETGYDTGEFPETFRAYVPDSSPRPVFKDPYDAAQMSAAASDPTVAIARGVTFQRARFMMERS